MYIGGKGVSEVLPERQSAGDSGTLQSRTTDSVSVTVVQRMNGARLHENRCQCSPKCIVS